MNHSNLEFTIEINHKIFYLSRAVISQNSQVFIDLHYICHLTCGIPRLQPIIGQAILC